MRPQLGVSAEAGAPSVYRWTHGKRWRQQLKVQLEAQCKAALRTSWESQMQPKSQAIAHTKPDTGGEEVPCCAGEL